MLRDPDGTSETPSDDRGTTSLRQRALIIFGLSALAITQPVLGLFGDNAEFFVAGNYTTAQIVLFAALVTLTPALTLICITSVSSLVDRRVGGVVFDVAIGLLAAAFTLVVARTFGVGGVWIGVIAAAAVGVGAVYLVQRVRAAQMFVSYLAAANLLFVGLFLFVSPASELVASDNSAADIGTVAVPTTTGPVVVVVFDELPVTTLMSPDGSINAERYPHFAELAEVTTWFRNASSPHPATNRAVPSIMTGTLGDEAALPTYFDHPRNLFTLLGGSMPIHRYESLTNLCPPPMCESPAPLPLAQALKDASLVYGHRVLPTALSDDLPAIDDSWGGFDDDEGTQVGEITEDSPMAFSRWRNLEADLKSPAGQASAMAEQITLMTSEPALHFVHVGLPHNPWSLSPSGVSDSSELEPIDDPEDPAFEFRARTDYQLHSLQTGAVDVLVGQLLDQLRASPAWDDTTLVVTADHGMSFTPPDVGREEVTPRNREEVLRTPLFIKAPGQTTGSIDDTPAQSIDILPSIVDLLDVEVDRSWRFDGHSLFDGSAPTVEPVVSADVDDAIAIAARRGEEFPHGEDWVGLAAVGDHGDLVGRRVDDVEVGEPTDYTAAFDQQDLFGDLPTEEQTAPFVLTGTVTGSTDRPPPELVAAINGRFAGIVGGYRPAADGWAFTGYVGDAYREGANVVELYEVERAGGSTTVRVVRPTS